MGRAGIETQLHHGSGEQPYSPRRVSHTWYSTTLVTASRMVRRPIRGGGLRGVLGGVLEKWVLIVRASHAFVHPRSPFPPLDGPDVSPRRCLDVGELLFAGADAVLPGRVGRVHCARIPQPGLAYGGQRVVCCEALRQRAPSRTAYARSGLVAPRSGHHDEGCQVIMVVSWVLSSLRQC